MKAKKRKYLALFVREDDQGFSVSVPDLPGCFTQGDSFEKAVENINEAIELYLEDMSPSEKDLYAPYRVDEQFVHKV